MTHLGFRPQQRNLKILNHESCSPLKCLERPDCRTSIGCAMSGLLLVTCIPKDLVSYCSMLDCIPKSSFKLVRAFGELLSFVTGSRGLVGVANTAFSPRSHCHNSSLAASKDDDDSECPWIVYRLVRAKSTVLR